ncbi:MAG: hypothetical protein Q7U91_13230 [Sideroxyarcus sp.]|nr:hypothetical protein [Sideroxyarcus sp.]
MKKIALAGAILVLAMAAGGASAAGNKADFGPSTGTFGFNVGIGTIADTTQDFMVAGKYFFAKDMAILAGAGLQFVDNGQATNNTSTSIGLMGGFRKYLVTEGLSPFVGGQLQYSSTEPGGAKLTNFALIAEAGAEYFFSKQFSVEGSVFAGYLSSDNDATGNKATVFGTAKGNLSVNFYF